MLATEAKRFRSGEDGDEGSSEAQEPNSQRKRLANAIQISRDERECSKARSEGQRAPSPNEGNAGHGDVMVRDFLPCPAHLPTLTDEAREWFQAAAKGMLPSDPVRCLRCGFSGAM
jgi:hypothetical protein